MATTAKNRITRSVRPASAFESAKSVISSASTWNQGDLVYFDDTANVLKAVTSDANCATFCGIARQSVVAGKLVSSYQGTSVDAAQAIEELGGPQSGVIAKLKLKSGDTFNPGDLVYGDSTDAQTVSSAGTNAIGIFQDAAIVASSGSEGQVLLGLRFRTSGLVI
jgi:hypothetical protein